MSFDHTFADVPPIPLDRSTVEVLRSGNERQQAAYDCVVSHNFLPTLGVFRGVLASTIALGVDTPTSDLDFLCEVPDLDHFSRFTVEQFGAYDRFRWASTPTPQMSRCCSFWCDGFEVEVYGSLERLENQFGFRHYAAMARLIAIGGDAFRTKLRERKLQGLKSEPAIAQLLSLSGDPYRSVAALCELDDGALGRLLAC